jgi:SNF2 family DNA or RNA helicase
MFYDITPSKRKTVMANFIKNGGIMLTSYGMIKSQLAGDFLKQLEQLATFKIDAIVLDEGHKMSPKVRTL